MGCLNLANRKRATSVYELQAEICKILASPVRIEILTVLKDGEKTVAELVEALDMPKTNISQHLSVMKMKGILRSRRDGVSIHYSIAHLKIIEVCSLMKEVLSEHLSERAGMAKFLENAE